MISLITYITVFITAFLTLKTAVKFRENEFNAVQASIWGAIWITISVLSLLPDTTTFFANLLGIGRGVDLAVYIAILALLFFVFKLYAKLNELEQELTTLVRELAKQKT